MNSPIANTLKLCIFLSIWSFLNATIINQSVDRYIDLSTQVATEKLQIVAENTGKEQIKEYDIIVPIDVRKNIAYFSATDPISKKELKFREVQNGNEFEYKISIPATMAAKPTFNVDIVYLRSVHPYPVEIRQTDKQLVKYVGFLYFYSPYFTATQKTSVKLSSTNVISHTQVKPFALTPNKIKYGPYNDIPIRSNETLSLHYENETPFITVRRLERTIEVSHWGNVAIKESIHLDHSGAKLKGTFSRYDFQKDGRSGLSSVKSYKTLLPSSAVDVYYRDSNGNISTSNMRVMRDYVELELRPRFPLFGGWRTQYTLGYNVPSFEYLLNSNDDFLLKMRVIDHIYDNMIIDEVLVTIILPEGSKNIKLSTPYPVTRHPDSLHFTYLDAVGRPVIAFSKRNLVENHIADFNLKYTFSSVFLLMEPFLVTAFIFIIFIITIIIIRLDFSITTTNQHSHKE